MGEAQPLVETSRGPAPAPTPWSTPHTGRPGRGRRRGRWPPASPQPATVHSGVVNAVCRGQGRCRGHLWRGERTHTARAECPRRSAGGADHGDGAVGLCSRTGEASFQRRWGISGSAGGRMYRTPTLNQGYRVSYAWYRGRMPGEVKRWHPRGGPPRGSQSDDGGRSSLYPIRAVSGPQNGCGEFPPQPRRGPPRR